jgi:large subunit ribosomal protein L17
MIVAMVASVETGNGRITTTVTKAKWLRPQIERAITLGKRANSAQDAKDKLAVIRRLFSELRDDNAVRLLTGKLAERFASRPGGYTRVVKLSERRLGDSGFQACIEFVD